jgi:hypothetical protein
VLPTVRDRHGYQTGTPRERATEDRRIGSTGHITTVHDFAFGTLYDLRFGRAVECYAAHELAPA